MRICRIAIENFANFQSVDFATDDSLVVVGENKAGKSNLLRALRLVLDPSLPDRDRQLGLEHFWDGLGDEKLGATVKIEVDLTEFDDDDNLLAVLGGSLVDTEAPVVARVTYVYRPKAALEGAAPETLADYEFLVFGGDNEDNPFTAAHRRELPMDYLSALRDAEGDLLNWRRAAPHHRRVDLPTGRHGARGAAAVGQRGARQRGQAPGSQSRSSQGL